MAESELKLYELGYHLIPTIAQGKIEDVVRDLVTLIEKHEGAVRGGELPEMRDIAYAISQRTDSGKKEFKNTYFGWMNIDLAPDQAEVLKEELKGNESVLRFILLSKSVDDTPEGDMFSSKKKTSNSNKMDEDEIDEKIDELIEVAGE